MKHRDICFDYQDWKRTCEAHPHAFILQTPWYWQLLEAVVFNWRRIALHLFGAAAVIVWAWSIFCEVH
jgi:hypothetical protein